MPPAGPGPEPAPSPGPDPVPGTPDRFQAEGPLAAALKQLFEKARHSKVAAFRWVEVKLFDRPGMNSVHTSLAAYRDADIHVTFDFDLRDDEVERFHVQFEGVYAKASKVRSNLDPLLRAAREDYVTATYRLVFVSPLATAGDKEDAVSSLLTRNGSGEAYVEAEAAAQGGGR